MTPDFPLLGGCNCGAVRYEIRRPALAAYICHCHLCQKRTGSAFSLSAVFPDGCLAITAGTPKRTERILPNGFRNESWICEVCYSRILTRREDWGSFNLRAGALDDTSWVRPAAQMWVSSAQPWAVVPGILTYDEQPNDFGAVLAAAKARAGASGDEGRG